MTFSFKIRGVQEIAAAIKAKGKQAGPKIKAKLYLEAELVMTDSKTNYVPVKYGVLKNSGVVIPDPNPNKIAVTLGFGGAASEYAIPVHEDLDAHHTHGSAKYLERPLLAAGPRILKAIAEVDPFR